MPANYYYELQGENFLISVPVCGNNESSSSNNNTIKNMEIFFNILIDVHAQRRTKVNVFVFRKRAYAFWNKFMVIDLRQPIDKHSVSEH